MCAFVCEFVSEPRSTSLVALMITIIMIFVATSVEQDCRGVSGGLQSHF